MLPELNLLSPTKTTTFNKLVEEIAECNDAVDSLRSFERAGFAINLMDLTDKDIVEWRNELKSLIQSLMGEIMDIAQVCATQLYTFERSGVDIERYMIRVNGTIEIKNESGIKFIEVSTDNDTKQDISSMKNIDSVMSSIISSMGKIAQLGKKLGENGERQLISMNDGEELYVNELLSIILKTLGLLSVLKKRYNINIEELSKLHVEKLVQRGYVAFDKSA